MNIRGARGALAERAKPSHDDTRSLYHYLRVLRDRRWPLLGVLCASLSLALLATYLLPYEYRATAMVQIEPEREDFYGSWRRTGTDEEYQSHYLTQVETLTSNGLARRIIDDLALWEHRELTPWWKRVLGRADDENAVVERFRERISVSTLLGSTLVNVQFAASDARFAARVLNALVERFTKEHAESKRELTIRASDWMSEKIPALNSSLAEAEARLNDFRVRHDLVSIDGSVGLLDEQELTLASEELAQTRSELIEATRIFEQMSDPAETGAKLENLEIVRNDPLIQLAWALKSKALNERNTLAARYGPKHPRMIDAETELASLDDEIADQIDRVMSAAALRVQSLDRQLSATRGRFDRGEREVMSVQARRLEMRSLEREVQMQRELADQFIVDTVAARALDGFGAASASVIDHAVTPPTPHRPQRLVVLALVALSVGIFSVLFVFVRDFLDDRVRGTADVSRKLGVPLLGVVPDLDSARVVTGAEESGGKTGVYHRDERVAEMVNGVRTAVMTDPRERVAHAQVLLVTASVESEGCSTAAVNLAHAFARLDRVLLIDCHLRRPAIAALAGEPDARLGLNTLVTGESSVEESIRRGAFDGAFDVLPAVRDLIRATDVVSSERFEHELERLRERYRWIVLDAAPVQRDSSGVVLARLADAVIYVVESNSTTLDTIARGMRRIRGAGGCVAGVLVNRVDLRKVVSWRGAYDYASYCGAPAGRELDARRLVVEALRVAGQRVVETRRELDAGALAARRTRWRQGASEFVRSTVAGARNVELAPWLARARAVGETLGGVAGRCRDGAARARWPTRDASRAAFDGGLARCRAGVARVRGATHEVSRAAIGVAGARCRDGVARVRGTTDEVSRAAVGSAAARGLDAAVRVGGDTREVSRAVVESAAARCRDGAARVRRVTGEVARPALDGAAARCRGALGHARRTTGAASRTVAGIVVTRCRDGVGRVRQTVRGATRAVVGVLVTPGHDGMASVGREGVSIGRRARAGLRALPTRVSGRLRNGSRRAAARFGQPDANGLRPRLRGLGDAPRTVLKVGYERLRNAGVAVPEASLATRRAPVALGVDGVVGSGGGVHRPPSSARAPLPMSAARAAPPALAAAAPTPPGRRSVPEPIARDAPATRRSTFTSGFGEFDGPVVIDADIDGRSTPAGADRSDRRHELGPNPRPARGEAYDWLASLRNVRLPGAGRAAPASPHGGTERPADRRQAVREA